ncbi:MAG: efflux RND transporter periplasmic adaptor subunit [bacterium]|nr:MAG: efflux RND transporter periplasmic adaptor subunit [bacterium]
MFQWIPIHPAGAAETFPWRPTGLQTAPGELDGFIEPYLVINLGSEVTGVLASVRVDRGDFVKKGQVLAVLDSRVERATTDLNQVRVDFSTREHERTRGLFGKGIIPDMEMDEARTGMAIAQAELRQAQAILARRTITSPMDGFVVERFLSPGEQVGDQPIMRLAQLDPLNVEVIVPVSMIGTIKVGQKAEVRPEEPVSGKYTGTVKIVDRVVDAASGTFGVRIELANRQYTLPAGLKCRVRFLK